MRPIGLRLLTGKRLQAQKWLVFLGTQARDGAPQLNDAARVTAIASHLINTGCAQARMLLQGLANELQVRIHDGGAQGRCAAEALRLDGQANGVGMHAQFTGNGANFPVLGVEVMANLHTGFRTDHKKDSLSFWNMGKWVNQTSGSTAKAAAQPRSWRFSRRRADSRDAWLGWTSGNGWFTVPTFG